ncbi:MAG: tetratricopeptide repeat protein [Planctomycetes bacterium]|nr:tetratricopeptide repeat protein [Planctomycetota bacterium]
MTQRRRERHRRASSNTNVLTALGVLVLASGFMAYGLFQAHRERARADEAIRESQRADEAIRESQRADDDRIRQLEKMQTGIEAALRERGADTAESAALRTQVAELTEELEKTKSSLKDERKRSRDRRSSMSKRIKTAEELAEIQTKLFTGVVDRAQRARMEDEELEPADLVESVTRAMLPRRNDKRDSLAVASANHVVGKTYRCLRVCDKGEQHLRAAYGLRRKHLGAAHEDTLDTMRELATATAEVGRWGDAIEMQRALVEHHAEAGKQNRVDSSGEQLGFFLRLAGRYDEAIAIDAERLERLRAKEKSSLSDRMLISRIAERQLEAGKPEDAEPLYREVLESYEASDGADASGAFSARCGLALALHRQGRLDEAQPHYATLSATARFMRRIDRPYTSAMYGEYLMERGEYEEAEPYLKGRFDRYGKIRYPGGTLVTELARRRLVALYDAWGKTEEADRHRRGLIGADAGDAR